MEEPGRNQEKHKKNMSIKIGAGGIGGIVLLGGALVTATLVSAFAIKTRRHRKNWQKTPPKGTTNDDPPANNLELMMKNNKDRDVVSKGFSLLNFPDSSPSSDATTKMGMIQIEPTQILILDEKPKLEINGETMGHTGNDEEIVFSAIHKEADSTKLMEESSEEIEAVKENEEIYRANHSELEMQFNVEGEEECDNDDGGGGQKIIEEKCEELGIQLSEEIPERISDFQNDSINKDEFSLPVLAYENECTTEQPLISRQALELIQEDDEVIETGSGDQVEVEEKEEILYGNARDITVEASVERVHAGDVSEEDKEGIGQFSNEQENGTNNNDEAVCSHESISAPLLTESIELVREEEEEAIEEAVDVDDEIKVEDNLPDLKILEEEEEAEENLEDGHGEIIPENRKEDQIVREEEQQMQEEEYDKSLSLALIQVMEEEEATEATCVDPIKVEDSPEMQKMDEEREEEDEIDNYHGEVIIAEKPEESSAYADQVAVEVDEETTINGGNENLCSDKSISVEKFSLPLLESELLSQPEIAKENESTTSLLSSEAINVITEDDRSEVPVAEDDLQKQLVEEKDQTPEMQSSEKEEEGGGDSDEDITEKAEESSEGTGDSSMESNADAIWPAMSVSPEINSAKIKHIDEDKTMENDDIINGNGEIFNEEKGNNEIATSFEQRYILTDPWKLKAWTLSMMVPLWCCLCHWYFGMPLIKLCLVGIMFLIVVLLGFPKPMLLTRK